jgi:hypothetical protein
MHSGLVKARGLENARGGVPSVGPYALSMRGSALVGVMAITTAVLLVGVAIFILGHAEGDLVEYAVDDARAFYVAEGGLERARAWLGDLLEDDPSASPVGVSFENQTLGGGTYTVSVTDDLSGGSWLAAYRVVCTAEVDGVTRSLQTVMIPETLAKYQWFIERADSPWFRTGERFEGPVHVNGRLRISGDPWFGGLVTVGRNLRMRSGSDPTFERGYQLNVERVDLPTVNELRNSLRTAALNGGLYEGTLPHNRAFYHVRLGHPSPGDMTYEGLRPQGAGYVTLAGPHTVSISTLNGAVWFNEPVAIEGTLDGRLTIVANGDIDIWDDLLYDGSTPGSGPDPDCDDVLGLIAIRNVEITYNVANRNDCEIHGVLVALNRNVTAERYWRYPPRGDLFIYGGFVADRSILLGRYRSNGSCTHGYDRNYRLDPRLSRTPPPFFPLTGRYTTHSWEEMDPPEA